MTVNLPPGAGPIETAIKQLAEGRTNAAGTATLTVNAASTTVKQATCGRGNKVFLFATTANAAAEVGNGTIRIPAATVTEGQFVIQHANNAQNDRTFFYVVFG
jgi:hypothetical protein